LDSPAGSDDIGCRHAVDLAPLHFIEEGGHGYNGWSGLQFRDNIDRERSPGVHFTQLIVPFANSSPAIRPRLGAIDRKKGSRR